MPWTVTHGDILDVPADVLVCSANVWLNLSGGVGGAILLRHGPAMQDELHRWLADRGLRHAPPGTVVATAPHGLAASAVLHAVAVDGFYDTTADRVRQCVADALRMAAERSARRVVLTALGTGYGRLPLAAFGRAIAPPWGRPTPPPVEQVVVCVRRPDEADLLRTAVLSP